MGQLVECNCDNCGYYYCGFVGFGMCYTLTYTDTIEDIKDGKFGNQAKEFFEAFPDGAIDAEKVIIQCDQCRALDTVPDLTLYVKKEYVEVPTPPKRIKPKHKKPEKKVRYHPKPKQTNEDRYKAPWVSDLCTDYIEFEKYKHVCKYCGGTTCQIDLSLNKPLPVIPCPECDKKIKIGCCGFWD